jgi:MtN3 and saliva related transmembrane protein
MPTLALSYSGLSWLVAPKVTFKFAGFASTLKVQAKLSPRDKYAHHAYHFKLTAKRTNQLEKLDILGLVATAFTTSSFIPQVWTTWRTKDVSGISLPTYIIITIGLFLWLLYGLFKGDMPLIVANAVMVVLTAAITVMKLSYGKETK